MIKCSECGAQLEKNISTCPNCGNPITNEDNIKPSKVENFSVNKTSNKGGKIATIFFIVLIGGVFLFSILDTVFEDNTESNSNIVGSIYIGNNNKLGYKYELELKSNNKCVWTSKYTDGKPSASDCTYSIDNNSMTLKVGDDEKGFVYTTSDNFMTLIREYDDFTLTKITNSEDRIVDDTQSDLPLEMLKNYTVVETSDGNKKHSGWISFKNDGTCSVTFAGFNNCSSSEEFCVFYRPGNCTYEMDENNVITVDDNSYFEVKYSYKLGDGTSQSNIIENDYVMKGIKFKFTAGNKVLETINGKWDIKNGSQYYYVTFTADS